MLTDFRVATLGHMKLVGALVLVAAVAGCGGVDYGSGRRPARSARAARSPEELKEALKRVLANSREDAERQVVWVQCEIPMKPGRCGLAISKWSTPEGREAFRRSHPCPEEHGTEECQEFLGDSFRNELPTLYHRANRPEIGQFCSSDPQQCDTLTKLELAWLKSHNATVFAEWDRRDKHLIEEHLAEGRRYLAGLEAEVAASQQELVEAENRRAAVKAIGAAFHGFGSAFQGGPIECTSDYSCRVGWKCIKTTNGSFCAGR